MPDFKIFETKEFLKQLGKLPLNESTFLRNKLNGYIYPQLRIEPFYGKNIKKLRGYSPDTWRYRIGSFRVFYIVDKKEHIVFILTIDARRNAYKK
ncbi:MAG: type II toxin-antitoxin system RelE/ParE family toxin [Candidatus Aegiribacteria sp.]|nr:type II toxin-antitoxin system RelE/ParE family toxin [Candidatus Aegiribacteria sp.]